MCLEFPWLIRAPAHFLPVGEACQGLVAGLFLANIGGPWHKPGLLRLCQQIVLAAKSHVLESQELIPVQGLECWWCRVIILYFQGMASHLWYLKGCLHPPGKFLDVILAGNFSELLLPCWHFHMLCVPVDPLIVSLRGGLRCQGLLRVIFWSVTSPRHFFSCQELLDSGVKSRQALKVLLLCSGFWSGSVKGLPYSFFISPGQESRFVNLDTLSGAVLKSYLPS